MLLGVVIVGSLNVAKVRSTSVSDDGWVLKNFPAAFREK